jgi:hypothetical protein
VTGQQREDVQVCVSMKNCQVPETRPGLVDIGSIGEFHEISWHDLISHLSRKAQQHWGDAIKSHERVLTVISFRESDLRLKAACFCRLRPSMHMRICLSVVYDKEGFECRRIQAFPQMCILVFLFVDVWTSNIQGN